MATINLIPDDFAAQIEAAQNGDNPRANEHADALATALAGITSDQVADDGAVRNVGRAIDDAGGLPLMQLTWYRLQAMRPLPAGVTPLKVKLVQYAWDGIGEWCS